jgi:hypothetical protein
MTCELFTPWKPHAATFSVVEQANTIIREYQAQGFLLTLRQPFYQFVARGLLENLFAQYGSAASSATRATPVDRLGARGVDRVTRNVAFWHEREVPPRLTNVGYRG